MAKAPAHKQGAEEHEKRQRHEHGQHGHADALADLESAVGDGTAFDDFGEIIQQMPPIQ